MEQYILYLQLKEIIKELDSKYKCTFNDMDLRKDNAIGIYIKGGDVSKYRSLSTGEYYNSINRVQFLIQGGLNNKDLMNALSMGNKIKITLSKTNNRSYTVASKLNINEDMTVEEKKENEEDQLINLIISKVSLLSDLTSLGKTVEGRPLYSINFRIEYNII